MNLLRDWGACFTGLQIDLDEAGIGPLALLELMETLPVAIAVAVGREHRYVFANRMFRSALQLADDDPRGKTVAEVLGGNASTFIALRDKTLRAGIPQEMAAHALRPHPGGGKGYWDIKWLPVRSAKGGIVGVLTLGLDVTKLIEAREEAQRQAREAEYHQMRLAIAIDATRLGLWEWDPRTNQTSWSKRQREMFGVADDEEVTTEVWLALLHPEDRDNVIQTVARLTDPQSGGEFDLEYRILHPVLGERWIAGRGQMIYSAHDGALQPDRLLGTVQDITARKQAEQERRLLLRETHHRLQNLFTVASALVKLTSRSSGTPAEMADKLVGRIDALARAHELLAPAIAENAGERMPTSLRDLVMTILAPHTDVADRASRLRVDGPDIVVGPHAATALTLILHELATNATKYGCLSVEGGELHILWAAEEPEIALHWHEIGGPPVGGAPEKQGFGSRLVKGSLSQLDAMMVHDWAAGGLRLVLRMGMSRLRK
jgi:PAS domain S-box-containing protein